MKMTQEQMRQGICSVLTDARPQDKGGRATFKTATAAANAARAAEAGAKEALEECKKVVRYTSDRFDREGPKLVADMQAILAEYEKRIRNICRVTLAIVAILALAVVLTMVLLTP